MAKDSLTLVLGIFYIIFVGLAWVTLFMPYSYIDHNLEVVWEPFIVDARWGAQMFAGCVILVPSAILILLFIRSAKSVTFGMVGVGIGIAGWIYCLIAVNNGLVYAVSTITPHLILTLIIIHITLGGLLVWRSLVVNPIVFKRKPIGKDKKTVALGFVYLGFIALQLSQFFIPFYYIKDSWIYQGTFLQYEISVAYAFFGLMFLVASFVFVLIYVLSSTSIKKGIAGFILGILGWIFFMISVVNAIETGPIFDRFGFLIEILSFDMYYISLGLNLVIIVFGVISFWRLFQVRSLAINTQPPGRPCSQCDFGTVYKREYRRYYCEKCKIYI